MRRLSNPKSILERLIINLENAKTYRKFAIEGKVSGSAETFDKEISMLENLIKKQELKIN